MASGVNGTTGSGSLASTGSANSINTQTVIQKISSQINMVKAAILALNMCAEELSGLRQQLNGLSARPQDGNAAAAWDTRKNLLMGAINLAMQKYQDAKDKLAKENQKLDDLRNIELPQAEMKDERAREQAVQAAKESSDAANDSLVNANQSFQELANAVWKMNGGSSLSGSSTGFTSGMLPLDENTSDPGNNGNNQDGDGGGAGNSGASNT